MTVVDDIERLLRRVEIKRLFEDPQGMTPDEMARISCQLMSHALETSDWRYLNAALKLNDRLRLVGHPDTPGIDRQEAACMMALRRYCGL